MNKRKINIPIKGKLIIKNRSPKNKNQYGERILNKKENKSSQQIIVKPLDFYKKKVSPRKINIADRKSIKNNDTNKMKENKNKKRQNKFLNKQRKEKGLLLLNSNLNTYRLIHSKDNKCLKDGQQNSSIKTDSMNSYVSNISNKIGNNNYFSLLNINEKNDSYSKRKIDSDISNNSKKDNIKSFYEKKDNIERNPKSKKIQFKNATKKIRINIMNPNPFNNLNKPKIKNIIENNNNDTIDNEKQRHNNNNMKENKSEYNIKNFEKNIINKKKEKNNIYVNKDIEKLKESNSFNKKGDDNLNKLFFNLTENKYMNYNFNDQNKNNYSFFLYTNELNKEKDCKIKQNLNQVKKSLFSEHMNFLLSHKDKPNNEIDYSNYFIDIPYNSILDSTDKIDYESKFINYDLGKTTGTSLSRDTVYALTNKNNISKKENSKIIDISKNQNSKMNIEEKERSSEEMEKLAKDYLNMTKYLEKADSLSKKNMALTNTITTIIDNNNYNDDTILTEKNY